MCLLHLDGLCGPNGNRYVQEVQAAAKAKPGQRGPQKNEVMGGDFVVCVVVVLLAVRETGGQEKGGTTEVPPAVDFLRSAIRDEEG